MNTTRTGKIARLPKSIRDDLNELLADGETAANILEWLNEEEAVRDVMIRHFGGRAINEPNLTEWRQGGHQDWLREQQALAFAGQLVERSGNLADQCGHQRLPDHFATLLATEFIKLAETMLDEHQDTKQRWDCLGEIQDRLSRYRRDDHRAIRASIYHQRWTRQFKAEDEAAAKAADQEERRQHVTRYRILRSGMLADEAIFFGKDDLGRDIAAMSLEEQHNLKFGLLGRRSEDFALQRDTDEHKYPWRRPLKNRTPQTPEYKAATSAADHRPPATQVEPPETRDNPSPVDTHPKRIPSPGGEGQDEGELPSRVAANFPSGIPTTNPPAPTPATSPADNSRSTQDAAPSCTLGSSTPTHLTIQSSTNPNPPASAIPLANDNPPPCRFRHSLASPEAALHRPPPSFETTQNPPENPEN